MDQRTLILNILMAYQNPYLSQTVSHFTIMLLRKDIRFALHIDGPLDKLDIEFRRLQNSLRKWKDAVFTFLYNKKVPSDNNGSEREIRKAKIKMKVSQCFRSFKGAEAFDVLHSLMDTAKKNGQSAFNVIRAIAYPKAIADGVYLQF